MIANLLVACSAALCGAFLPASDTPDPPKRFFLSCKGTMQVAGNSVPSQIMADGIVDLGRRRVYGFGLGGEQIIVLAARQIDFASREGAGPSVIDGSIDLDTGKTTITTRSARNPDEHLIDMALDCEAHPPPLSD
jgi:hypothetical protein